MEDANLKNIAARTKRIETRVSMLAVAMGCEMVGSESTFQMTQPRQGGCAGDHVSAQALHGDAAGQVHAELRCERCRCAASGRVQAIRPA